MPRERIAASLTRRRPRDRPAKECRDHSPWVAGLPLAISYACGIVVTPFTGATIRNLREKFDYPSQGSDCTTAAHY